MNRPDKVITVSVPEDSEPVGTPEIVPEDEGRESIRIQALIATIGAKMGMSIWIPRADHNAVLKVWKNDGNSILEFSLGTLGPRYNAVSMVPSMWKSYVNLPTT